LAKFSPGSIYGGARFVMACNRDVWREANRYASAAQAGVHLIHHGIDFSDWHYQDKPAGAADESVRLLFVGRFVEKKGLDVLFRALARYREEGGSFELSLFGQGPLAEPMRHMVEALGLADFVSWHDVVSREQIAREMHRHDALVMPSVRSHEGDRDGIPNVVVEAMACGLPVIGSDAGSLPDVLSDETGWCFAAGDDLALVRAIRDMRDAGESVRDRTLAARELVVREFNARTLARTRAALLQTVLPG
jgi:glycosyltransferase involved in cell wall biosynthesis